jgi:hypothetical protein
VNLSLSWSNASLIYNYLYKVVSSNPANGEVYSMQNRIYYDIFKTPNIHVFSFWIQFVWLLFKVEWSEEYFRCSQQIWKYGTEMNVWIVKVKWESRREFPKKSRCTKIEWPLWERLVVCRRAHVLFMLCLFTHSGVQHIVNKSGNMAPKWTFGLSK